MIYIKKRKKVRCGLKASYFEFLYVHHDVKGGLFIRFELEVERYILTVHVISDSERNKERIDRTMMLFFIFL